MNKEYEIFYNQKKETIKAPSLYAAKLEAIRFFGVPKSKQGLIAVQLKNSNDFMFN